VSVVDHERRVAEHLGLAPEQLEQRLRRFAEDLHRVQIDELPELRELSGGDQHVLLHRGSVGMHLEDRHLGPRVVEVDVVGEWPRLVLLDERGELLHRSFELGELPFPHGGAVEHDDRV
jgi:hypothetical protein